MSDYAKKTGIEYDVRTGRSFPYYDEEPLYVDHASNGTRIPETANPANTDATPINRDTLKRRVYDTSTYLADQQAALPRGFARKLSLGNILPPVLNAITVHFSKSSGVGSADHLATDMENHIDIAGSITFDPRSTAQASASIVPAVTWDIDTWQQDAEVNATEYEIIDAPGKTVAQLVTRLNTQLAPLVFTDLPLFKKKAVQLVLKGSQVSLQQSADSDISISVDVRTGVASSSKKKGSSNSTEVGVNIRVETTPYCIHGALTLTSDEDSASVTVTVKANIPDITDTPVTGITNEPTPLSGDADGDVMFANGTDSIAATSPAAIPTSGLYVVAVNAQDDALGAIRYVLTVVDFAQYA